MGLECKSWKQSQKTPRITEKFCIVVQNEAGQNLTEFCQENMMVTANTFPTTREMTLYMDITRCSIMKPE
mgnify:CR=1 FL=1